MPCLLLTLGAEAIVRLHADAFQGQPERRGFKLPTVLNREDLLVVDADSHPSERLRDLGRLRRNLVRMLEMRHDGEALLVAMVPG